MIFLIIILNSHIKIIQELADEIVKFVINI